ncbi:MAG TPA: FAD-dependent 5-carboxymethylaminomethyl-2-thiouridine(34) oxidoreductase MnmC [Phenylobacterium sp.]|nr:FAD-dependent 5-carboxymethylaminomethyl-2-thiouridine(34) oxidoreductase MnmC [Phenylobacterium sp.]
MSEPSPPSSAAIDWTAEGQPRSRLYGDVYFSAQDGLAESRAVFLAGCGLPDGWAGRRRFVVGELGFGTGLNVAALLQLWRGRRPAGAKLHIFSIEAHPIAAQDAARALGRWPELSEVAAPLLASWPGRARGLHRCELPDGVILDVAVLDAAEALRRWAGRADAWFLDGFSPALNPAMWSEEVLALVAARSQAGARAATFTVAGQVRRGLAAAGFAVEKRPGFGAKRERLEARLPGEPAAEPGSRRVAIVGAGVAGAAAARAVRALGGEALVLEAESRGAGASGNPAALVTPRLDAGLGPPAELFAQAFRRAVAIYEDLPEAILARGVLQLVRDGRDAARFERIAASDLFEPQSLAVRPAEEVTARLGEPAPAALDQLCAVVVDPAPILAAWAGAPRIAEVAAMREGDGGWILADAEGREIARAEAVILAAGMASTGLVPDLPLRPVRGQASWTEGERPPAAAWGGYVLPTRTGALFGATQDRDDADTDTRPADHARNLATLAEALPALASRLGHAALAGRAALRATTPDRLPLAGPAPGAAAGPYLLTGFGSRGFSLAPLLAELVAAQALGAPSPLPSDLAELVAPHRFLRRAARRGGS